MTGRRGPRTFVWLVLLTSLLWPMLAATQQEADTCRTCHLELEVERLTRPAKEYKQDVHAAKGFSCIACHGGDSHDPGMEAMDPDKGYIGVPKRQQITAICGRCHADARFMKRYNPALRVDQVAEYNTSVHGRRLRQLGDEKVAICTSCHPAHNIKPPSDPTSSVYPLKVAETCGACHADPTYMEPYDIPVDQLQKYQESVHWKMMSVKGDLSAPTCNDCHGNHGASPPGVAWVGNVCEQCHAVIAQLFSKSAHAKIFVQMGSPGCATCHNNHRITAPGDDMLGIGDAAVCGACHAADDQGGQVATTMHGLIRSLRDEFFKSRRLLLDAEHAGMEVSAAEFELNTAMDNLVKARNAVHTFTVEPVKTEVDAGLETSTKAYERGQQALTELQFRRKGLAVSVVIIVALIGGLTFKIRQIERG